MFPSCAMLDPIWAQVKLGPSWAQVGSCVAQLKAKDSPRSALVGPRRPFLSVLIPWVRAVLVAKRLESTNGFFPRHSMLAHESTPHGCSSSSLKARGRTCLDLELRTVTTLGSVRPKLVLVFRCKAEHFQGTATLHCIMSLHFDPRKHKL
eukprot:s594_g3.t1